MISLIVAASTNNIIGVQGELPWQLSDDLKRFKSLTIGKPIVMGRLTWESIGRALPERQNIVITRQKGFAARGADVVESPAQALQAAGIADEIMIIGGSQIYELFLPKAETIYLTRVHAEVSGDASFPAIDELVWQRKSSESRAANESNDHDFDFETWVRTKQPARVSGPVPE